MGFNFADKPAGNATLVYNSSFWVDTQTGYSGALDWDTEEFDTDNWHDTAYAVTSTALGTQTSTTLQDTGQSWTVNQYTNYWVVITGGTGAYQRRKISSNTSDTLTISPAWTTTPDGTSTYKVYSNSRITVKETGLYAVKIGFGWESGSGIRGIRIDVNSVFKAVQFFQSPSTITEGEGTFCRLLQLTAGDYVEMQSYQDTGSNLRYIGAASRTWFSLVRVG